MKLASVSHFSQSSLLFSLPPPASQSIFNTLHFTAVAFLLRTMHWIPPYDLCCTDVQ